VSINVDKITGDESLLHWGASDSALYDLKWQVFGKSNAQYKMIPWCDMTNFLESSEQQHCYRIRRNNWVRWKLSSICDLQKIRSHHVRLGELWRSLNIISYITIANFWTSEITRSILFFSQNECTTSAPKRYAMPRLLNLKPRTHDCYQMVLKTPE